MQPDTEMGGARRKFPPTRFSIVAGLSSRDGLERERAVAALVGSYWKPVYKYLRLRWRKGNEDAKDLTQAFFAAVLEKRFLAGYDPARASFRGFLRLCLDRFAANADRAERAEKRGGGARRLELDFDGVEGELARGLALEDADPARWFETEWRRAFFSAVVAELERECRERGREARFFAFARYDLAADPSERPTYAELGAELGLDATAVTNALAAARRDFRRLVLERLRAETASEEEFQDELRALLGPGAGA